MVPVRLIANRDRFGATDSPAPSSPEESRRFPLTAYESLSKKGMGLATGLSFMLPGRFFKRVSEPPMNTLLAVALMAACAANLVCVLGHL
jgi:hypothetical protein